MRGFGRISAAFVATMALLVGGLPFLAEGQSVGLRSVSWDINLNENPSGSAVSANGVLAMQAGPQDNGLDFPYAVAAGNPFPLGDFDMTFQVAYDSLSSNGDGLVILSKEGTSMFWVWGGINYGIKAGINGLPWSVDWDHPAKAEADRPFFQVSNGASANTYTFSMRGTTVRLLVDGVERLTWQTELRPAIMYAGHPTVGQLAGVLPDGKVPVVGHMDSQGKITKRWWGPSQQPVWTTLALTAVEVSLPSVSLPIQCEQTKTACCTQEIPATARATGMERTRGRLVDGGLVDVRVSGHACVTASPEKLDLTGILSALGNLLVDVDDLTQVELRADSQDIPLNVEVGTTKDVSGLGSLPLPLPKIAQSLPKSDEGQPARLVQAIQLEGGKGQMNSVRVGFATQNLDHARIVAWDGKTWVNVQIGKNMVAGGANLQVFDVRQDSAHAIAVFDGPGTFALIADAAAQSAEPRASASPAFIFLALALLAGAWVRRESQRP